MDVGLGFWYGTPEGLQIGGSGRRYKRWPRTLSKGARQAIILQVLERFRGP